MQQQCAIAESAVNRQHDSMRRTPDCFRAPARAFSGRWMPSKMVVSRPGPSSTLSGLPVAHDAVAHRQPAGVLVHLLGKSALTILGYGAGTTLMP